MICAKNYFFFVKCPITLTPLPITFVVLPIIPLSAFFALWQGAGLTVFTPAGERRVTLAEGQPTLTLTVEKEGEGVRLFGDEAMPLMGARKLYLLYRGKLYRTNTDYTRRMAGWAFLTAGHPCGVALFLRRRVGGGAPLRILAGRECLAGQSHTSSSFHRHLSPSGW